MGSISGSGRSPGEGNGNPLQYSCLGNPMYFQRGLTVFSSRGHRVGHGWVTEHSCHKFSYLISFLIKFFKICFYLLPIYLHCWVEEPLFQFLHLLIKCNLKQIAVDFMLTNSSEQPERGKWQACPAETQELSLPFYSVSCLTWILIGAVWIKGNRTTAQISSLTWNKAVYLPGVNFLACRIKNLADDF